MAKKVISHPAETGRRKSASLRSFHERGRIAIEQVKFLKEVMIENGWITSEQFDELIDHVEDPGSKKAKRPKVTS